MAMNALAHEALVSHGWRHDGGSDAHGLPAASVDTYTHAGFHGHRINVASTGQWEHVAIPGSPATGGTARQLARYLAAVHGGVSIADLFLPGRQDDD